jgi:phosphatidylserine/phosphatidylglycerophosphate/cardiolipin synthase-like enzyme
VLVDGELSLVGTVNLDMRSLWLNFEITLVIDDAGFGVLQQRTKEVKQSFSYSLP